MMGFPGARSTSRVALARDDGVGCYCNDSWIGVAPCSRFIGFEALTFFPGSSSARRACHSATTTASRPNSTALSHHVSRRITMAVD